MKLLGILFGAKVYLDTKDNQEGTRCQMTIIAAFPPNIKDISAKFDLSGRDVVFAYGDKLFNPGGRTIPQHLMVHEETHSKQQAVTGVSVWWYRYLNDKEFRLEQEVEAYRAQYQFFSQSASRGQRRNFLKYLANELSSKLYGNLVRFETAKNLIEK